MLKITREIYIMKYKLNILYIKIYKKVTQHLKGFGNVSYRNFVLLLPIKVRQCGNSKANISEFACRYFILKWCFSDCCCTVDDELIFKNPTHVKMSHFYEKWIFSLLHFPLRRLELWQSSVLEVIQMICIKKGQLKSAVLQQPSCSASV